MIDVSVVLQLHESTVALWHEQPIENTYDGVMDLICKQHAFNFELWHEEDIARSKNVTDEQIATVKRNIDRLNQARNDHIEKIDDWLTTMLIDQKVTLANGARLNTETPGSAVDRLSIMSLRLFHYREQLDRDDVDQAHVDLVNSRIELCEEQRMDLSQSLRELLEDIVAGRKIHKTYRQMKMYNDPSLNPYLYQAKKMVG
ncbi:MAG: DUF4254 domain-containing protein [Planctomycetota bacterium]|nr:DUF4254 domain-containing protein [Planctomycetota bacterium]